MRKTTITFEIDLNDSNVPEKIHWEADDQTDFGGLNDTKSLSISIWDHNNRNTLRIDLWTKDMPVEEMKKFYIDSIGGLAQSSLNATGDEFFSTQMNELCDKLVEHVKQGPADQGTA